MIEVEVRRDDSNRQSRQRTHYRHDVASTCTRVKQDGPLGTDDQITVVALIVAWLADRNGGRVYLFNDVVIVNPASDGGHRWLWENCRFWSMPTLGRQRQFAAGRPADWRD